jgi:hypothetical protein
MSEQGENAGADSEAEPYRVLTPASGAVFLVLVVVAAGVLFVPMATWQATLGTGFYGAFAFVSAVEFLCAIGIAALIWIRRPDDIDERPWRYY